ncbi:MAG TPA: TldD/PmbA family protein [Syntrophomonadaceae bacterium]|mgnify:CR=1 FL=1|nr:TldD/PmbA family protein [Syntrophomonadaceae bacterium]
MQERLTGIGEALLDKAHRLGVDAEVFLLHNRELMIEVVEGQVDTLKEAEEMGLGLRVIKGNRLGFAFTSDLSPKALEEVWDAAVSICSYTASDHYLSLPSGPVKYPSLIVYDPVIAHTSIEEKIELARQAERASRQHDSRITVIERAGYEDSEFHSLILNTRGICAYAQGNYCGTYVFAVAEEDEDAQTGFSISIKQKLADLDPLAVGQEAAHNAVRSLHARRAPSGRIPCIMEPYVVTRFLGIIAQMVDAEAVQKGKSLFKGRIGQKVGAECISLTDDGTYPGGVSSFPFDSEGVPCQRTELIRDGHLVGYLYDTYTANRDHTRSTGNGQRSSFRGLPSVGSTNFMIEPGTRSLYQLMDDIPYGFYITEVMGMHTANPISGEFSVGAAGLLIEKGQLTKPVRGVTIAGNIMQLLEQVEAVGNDMRFFGGRGAPSLRIRYLSLSGE